MGLVTFGDFHKISIIMIQAFNNSLVTGLFCTCFFFSFFSDFFRFIRLWQLPQWGYRGIHRKHRRGVHKQQHRGTQRNQHRHQHRQHGRRQGRHRRHHSGGHRGKQLRRQGRQRGQRQPRKTCFDDLIYITNKALDISLGWM